MTADLTLNLDQLTLVTMHASASEEADACDMVNGGESCTHTHTHTHTHTQTHSSRHKPSGEQELARLSASCVFGVGVMGCDEVANLKVS